MQKELVIILCLCLLTTVSYQQPSSATGTTPSPSSSGGSSSPSSGGGSPSSSRTIRSSPSTLAYLSEGSIWINEWIFSMFLDLMVSLVKIVMFVSDTVYEVLVDPTKIRVYEVLVDPAYRYNTSDPSEDYQDRELRR